ncbi:hypothetical protein P152DRAFT_461703 [Eremomyces bilateralis CBS 781.70]|uniref:Uncharacterized protein n=1 Tax=Eremomyces bilateralis CBS 781.70 TaxID=1392243 RepID=A0A6G1FUE7_9PEZI|nr:uncharacterized protein P152DRAFT_461703 [Eremomyces bilateralis CBS 781.70]KAF1809289.1 hypothetical protein P152DRAFT_461703 [Eremomyces bilateralis CBS 781.70]
MQNLRSMSKERTHSVSSPNIDPNGHITMDASRDELILAVKRQDALLPEVPKLTTCTPANFEEWLCVLATRLKLLGLHAHVFHGVAVPKPAGPPTADDRRKMMNYMTNEMRAKCQVVSFISAAGLLAVKKGGFDEFDTPAKELFLMVVKWAGGMCEGGNVAVQEKLKDFEAWGII